MNSAEYKILSDNEAISTFREAKEIFWKNKMYFIMVIIVPILFSFGLSKAFGYWGSAIDFIIGPCFFIGQMVIFQKEMDGQVSTWGDLFTVFKSEFSDKAMNVLTYLFARVLLMLAVALVSILIFGALILLISLKVDPKVLLSQYFILLPYGGLILFFLLIPAVLILFFIFACTFFSLQLVWFNQVPIFKSFQISFRSVLDNTWPLTWWGLISVGINALGAFALLIGFFITMPITIIATYLLYKKIFLEEVSLGIQTTER